MARQIEAAGIPTVTVTMMPFLAERFRLSRVVGVQFPFGHAFGMPGDPAMQRTVSEAAIDLLGSATEPGSRVDVDIEWPVDDRTAYRAWQPSEPSPIVKFNQERRQRLEQERAARSLAPILWRGRLGPSDVWTTGGVGPAPAGQRSSSA